MQPYVRYERFIAELARTMLRDQDCSAVATGSSNKVSGASGVSHQLDVSFLDRRSSPHTFVVIECKCLGRNVELAHVKALQATVSDLAGLYGSQKTVVGYLVSLKGAQPGAKAYAEHYNIGLQVVADGSFYTFKYADLRLIATSARASGTSTAEAHSIALRKCDLCGQTLQDLEQTSRCSQCAGINQ